MQFTGPLATDNFTIALGYGPNYIAYSYDGINWTGTEHRSSQMALEFVLHGTGLYGLQVALMVFLVAIHLPVVLTVFIGQASAVNRLLIVLVPVLLGTGSYGWR
jgi:hypothetical protein